MKLAVLIIHLKRAVDRRANVDRLVSQSVLPTFVMDACDARDLTDSTRNEIYRPRLLNPHYPFGMKNTEIACFQSHRQIWKEIIDRRLDGALVFEDDIEVEAPAIYELLDRLRGEKHEFIKFSKLKSVSDFKAEHMTIRRAPPTFPIVGAWCYYVSAYAARVFFDQSKVFDRPVDAFMQMTWITGVPQLVIDGGPMAEISRLLGGSTIQRAGNQSRLRKLWREIRRPLYRLELRAHFLWHARIWPQKRT
jgi:GR25 family glycosyltransferase involved in LPS biosynthesis